MKKFTLFFVTVLTALSTNLFAAESLVASCDFTKKLVGHSAYVDQWTYDGWTVFGAANNNKGWAYAKFGGKAAYLATANHCYIFGQVANSAVTKIIVTTNKGNLSKAGSVNEWGVNVYSDTAKTNLVATIKGNTMTKSTAEELMLLPADGHWEANNYYEVYFNVANTTTTNGVVWVDKIDFYGEITEIPATAIELDQTALNLEIGTSATLVATLTPAEATTAVVWTSSDETVATVDNGIVNAVKAGNTTITATAGDGVTATCEVTVKEQTPKTLAEIDYTTDGTEYKLAPVTVVYVNGTNIYIQDATGAGLIYGSALTVNAGDLVSGLVVTTKVYNKLPELETTATNKDVTITSGDAPSPVEASAAPVAADVNKYLLLKNVVFAKDATTIDASNKLQNVTASFKGENVTIRDNFKITDGTILADTYEIEGFVCLYNTTVQFYPTKITSTPTAIDNATVAEKAVKMIEDGQLVIIREGVKYNAQGAVIR